MRLIDADALLPMLKLATTDSEIGVFPIMIGFDAIAKVLGEAPTIDAVPVTKCKDCKYWNGSGKYCDYEMSGLENDFCSWAKRKEE